MGRFSLENYQGDNRKAHRGGWDLGNPGKKVHGARVRDMWVIQLLRSQGPTDHGC